jgi:hypothetical protein
MNSGTGNAAILGCRGAEPWGAQQGWDPQDMRGAAADVAPLQNLAAGRGCGLAL